MEQILKQLKSLNYDIAVNALQEGDKYKTLSHLDKAISHDPYDINLYIKISNLLSINGLHREALGYAAAALAKHPSHPNCLRTIGEVLTRMRLYGYAALAFSELIENGGMEDNPIQQDINLRGLGTSLVRHKKNLKEAKKCFELAAALAPEKQLVDPFIEADKLAYAITVEPDFYWARYHLARIRIATPQADGVLELVQPMVVVNNCFQDAACEIYCESLRKGFIKKEAIQKINGFIKSNGQGKEEAFWYQYYLGLLLYHNKDWDKADTAFTKAKSMHLRSTISSSLGCVSLYINPRGLPDKTRPSLAIENNKQRESDKLVIFICCDGGYFDKYGLGYLKGGAQSCGDRLFHAHIVNPTPITLQTIDDLKVRAPNLRLNVSYETVNYKYPKPYFASARFLHANTLLDFYRLPLLITDVDCWINLKIDGIEEIEEIGLNIINDERLLLPWTEIMAGMVWLPPSTASRRFLHHIEDYFYSIYDPKQNQWFIDQNALSYAYRNSDTDLDFINLRKTRFIKILYFANGKEALAVKMEALQFPNWTSGWTGANGWRSAARPITPTPPQGVQANPK